MVWFVDMFYYFDYDFLVDICEDLDFVCFVYVQMSECDWFIDVEYICKLIGEQVVE